MSWLFSAKSNSAGTCHSTMTTLKATRAVQGCTQKRPSARNGLDHAPSRRARPTRRRGPTGSTNSSGSHGAPMTMRIGAKNMIRMCSIMWTKK